ncbi:transcriptional regulator [Caulobacter sp. SLTY]|nr:transcriptional regulator [Caulobacter sp. SLTY]
MIGTGEDEEPKAPHPEEIKAMIRMRGMTLSRLATKNGLSESACRAALIRPQPEAEKVISKFLGVALHELWPDRYDESGGRVRHVRDENNHERDDCHRLSAGAA